MTPFEFWGGKSEAHIQKVSRDNGSKKSTDTIDNSKISDHASARSARFQEGERILPAVRPSELTTKKLLNRISNFMSATSVDPLRQYEYPKIDKPAGLSQKKSVSGKVCRTAKTLCSSLLGNIDRSIQKLGREVEILSRKSKEWPPQKYFAQPLYRALWPRLGRPIATVVTFTACTIVFHQSVSSLTGYWLGKPIISRTDIALNILWGSLGAAAGYHKHRNAISRQAMT